MSKFLPIEKIVFKTKLSKEQTIKKLIDNIEAEKPSGFISFNYKITKPFIGKIIGNTFDIRRAINYRNSFLPQIKGEVYTEFDGTKIKVNMKPYPFVLIFMTVWFSLVIMACLAMIVVLFTQKFSPFFLVPFVMLFFGILLIFGGIKLESSKSKKELLSLLEAEIE